ncbi:MAG: ComEC/Rec2 family competence protein [Clostridiaceae bacterium]|nr:ComEC/Rec2 family competence protein [Clostridiaceae bacterium]
MTVRGRHSRAVAGRKLACFAAAFSVLMLILCYTIGDRWSFFYALSCGGIIFLALSSVMEHRQAAVISALAVVLAFSVFYTRIYPSYLGAIRLNGHNELYNVEVSQFAQEGEYYTVFEGVIQNGGKQKVSVVIYSTDLELAPGDIVSFDGKASVQDEKYFFSSMAEERFLTLRPSGKDIKITHAMDIKLKYFPAYFSKKIYLTINEYFKGDEAALLSALLTGNTDGISTGFSHSLSLSGTSHITSVSGLHISIIAGLLMYLLGKRFGMAASFPVMLFFGMTTGMNPPVVRSIIMSQIIALAFLANRENDGVTTVFVALLLIGCVDPFSFVSVSLQLSFSAVLGILLFNQAIGRTFLNLLPERVSNNRAAKYIASAFAVSISASFLSAPILMLYFERISIISPIANLAVLWLVPVIMALGLVFLPMSAIASASAVFAKYIVLPPIKLFIWIVSKLAAFPYSSISSHNYAGAFLIIIFWLFLIVANKVNMRLRRRAIVSFIVIAACFVSVGLYQSWTRLEGVIFPSGLVMIKSGSETVSIIPSKNVDSYILRDYQDCLYKWGMTSCDHIMFTDGLSEDDAKADSENIFCSGKSEIHKARLCNDVIYMGSVKGYIFGDESGLGYVLKWGERSVVYGCGVSKGSAAEEAIGGGEADILVLDNSIAGNYYQLKRILEKTSPKVVAVCKIDSEKMSDFKQAYQGNAMFIEKNESYAFQLK